MSTSEFHPDSEDPVRFNNYSHRIMIDDYQEDVYSTKHSIESKPFG